MTRFVRAFFFVSLAVGISHAAAVDALDPLELLLLGGDPASVTKGAELVIRENPGDPAAHEALGWIALLEGREVEAQEHFFQAVLSDPSDPRAEALLRDAIRFSERVTRFHELEPVCEEVLRAADTTFETRTVARRWLLYFAREERDPARTAAMETELGYLTDWLLVAPFIHSGGLDLYQEFEPEKEIEETYDLPALGEHGWLKMPGGAYQGYAVFDNLSPIPRGVGYALTYVRLPRDGRYRFGVTSDDSVVIWMDGIRVLERDAVSGYPAVESNDAGFYADAGWHRILVKCLRDTATSSAHVPVGWGFQLCLSAFEDGDGGGPVEGLECRADLALERKVSEGGVDAFRIEPPTTASDLSLDGRFHRALSHAHREDYDLAVAELEGLIEERSGPPPDGPSTEESARTSRPECVLLRLVLGWVLDADGSEERLGRARSQYNRVVEAAPETVPAQLALAELETAEGKYWSALERVNAVAEFCPESARVWLAMANLYRQKNITPREREALERALAAEPDHMAALYETGLFLRRHQHPTEAIEILRRLVELSPDHQNAWRDLADLLQSTGGYHEAARAYERFLELKTTEVDACLELARCHQKGGFGDRLADFSTVIERAPFDYRGYVQLALALEEDQGRLDRELYRRALELYPAKDWLRGYLAWRSNATRDEFMPDVGELIANAPEAADYPESDAVCLLDYLRVDVHADFAYSFAERRVYKFFSQSGVDRWAEMIIPDPTNTEVIYARTYTPDGRVLDATVLTPTDEGLAVSLEGAVPGAVVDLYYRQYSEVRTLYDLLDYWSNRFYFREYSDPLLVSRFVVTVPEGMEPAFDSLNFSGRVERHRLPDGFTTDGSADIPVEPRVAYIYEEKDSKAIISEGLMPERGFFSPVVGLSTIEDPEDFFDWYWGKAVKALVPDGQVRELAHGLTDGLDDPRSKAEALYGYVVTRIKDRSGSIFFPDTVRETYYRRSGRPVDKLLLWTALAREVGLEPEICLTRSRWDTPMLTGAFSPIDFTDAVGRLPLGGEVLWVDFSMGRVALGEISPVYEEQPYWRCASRKMERFGERDPLDQRVEIAVRVDLDETGRGSGTLEETYHGLSAGNRVNYLDPETASRNLDAELNSFFPGASLGSYDFAALENLAKPFGYTVEFIAPNLAVPRGSGFVLDPVLYSLDLSNRFISRSERSYPMDVNGMVAVVEELRYTLPEGWSPTADSLFTERVESGVNGYLLEVARDSDAGDGLILRRVAVIPLQRVETSEYGEFREFCRRVDELERRRVTLVHG
ncbi:MAG TPA: tetratricopeptide repeat protein [bacterium]|nr:tetratricopeptide repeat protein [bacterium]